MLNRFYADKEIYNAVRDFLNEHLKDLAVKKTFNGEQVTGIKEAKDAIDNAFRQMEKEFGTKKHIDTNQSE